MPWVESADEIDEEFIDSVKNYNTHNRPTVLERINKYSDRNVIIFTGRNEADGFLKTFRERN